MDTHTTEPTRAQSNIYAWYVVLLCMLAYIFSFIDRQILALMIEPIKADLGLSDTQFSLLHGLAFSLFYAFMGLPLAYLADRFSRPKIIAIGVVFWSIATVFCGLSKNFIQLFLSRMGVGVGEAALSQQPIRCLVICLVRINWDERLQFIPSVLLSEVVLPFWSVGM